MLIIQIALGILVGWILIQALQAVPSNRDNLNSKLKTGIHKSKEALHKANKNIVDAWYEEGDYSPRPTENNNTQPLPIAELHLSEEVAESFTASEVGIMTVSVILWLVALGFAFL